MRTLTSEMPGVSAVGPISYGPREPPNDWSEAISSKALYILINTKISLTQIPCLLFLIRLALN